MRAWAAIALALIARPAYAQSVPPARLAVLQAEARRSSAARDLQVIRGGVRSRDPETVRIAVRALGRLEQPGLAGEILALLRHPAPEVREEAANAAAQALHGAASGKQTADRVATVARTLTARLAVEAEPSVRAALCEAIARLPYRTPQDVERAESTVLQNASERTGITDRLGIAKGLEALARVNGGVRPLGPDAVAWLEDALREPAAQPERDPLRDARVRRLAIAALTRAAAISSGTLQTAAADPDPQVRRLAVRAAATSAVDRALLASALDDPVGFVRLAALRAAAGQPVDVRCPAAVKAALDAEIAVALEGLDQLASCGAWPQVLELLGQAVGQSSNGAEPRTWHRRGHALIALASVDASRAQAALGSFASSADRPLRMYAARAAERLHDTETLEQLSRDANVEIANVALVALRAQPRRADPPAPDPPTALTAPDLRRFAAPRARITVRDVGRIDVALFTAEAPATVMRFIALAQAGAYNGRTFNRVLPGFVAATGDRAPADGARARPGTEVGLWPHVRGALGMVDDSNPDDDFFIDLVDNSELDHELTVFAQVLNGADLIDGIVEGDVIESIEIIP